MGNRVRHRDSSFSLIPSEHKEVNNKRLNASFGVTIILTYESVFGLFFTVVFIFVG